MEVLCLGVDNEGEQVEEKDAHDRHELDCLLEIAEKPTDAVSLPKGGDEGAEDEEYLAELLEGLKVPKRGKHHSNLHGEYEHDVDHVPDQQDGEVEGEVGQPVGQRAAAHHVEGVPSAG